MSIFVATGTTGFDALVREMDRLSAALSESVLIQIGRGAFLPVHTAYFRFAPSLEGYFRAADLVVAHGGLATCIEVLRLGKPLVGVAADDRCDDHQRDLLAVLDSKGYLLYCRDLSDLGGAISRARFARFALYQEPESTIHVRIREFLAEIAERRR